MADLYWNAPSSPGYYSDGNNWRVGSSSGPVSGVAPTTTDNVFFTGSSSTVSCTFDIDPSVNSFTAADPNSGFQLGGPTLSITVRNTFELSNASSAQASIFSILTSSPASPAVTITATGSGTKYINIGPWQIGRLVVQNSTTTSTTYLQSAQGSTIYPFKCYALLLNYGIAEFDVANCDGAHLGYPDSAAVSFTVPAINLSNAGGTAYKRLKMQFNSSKKVVLYNDFMAGQTSLSNTFDLTFTNSTIIEVRGTASVVQIAIDPTPAYFGSPLTPEQLPFVYNYLGEDISGTAVSSGGTLQFGGANSPYTWKPIKLYGLTCTAAGSVSGSFVRGIQMGTGYNFSSPTPFLYDLLVSYNTPFGSVTPIFNIAGDSTNQVTLTSNTSGVPSRFKFLTSSPPTTASISYTNLSYINADTTAGATYLAYTTNGNVNGGGNTNWEFTAASSGFLGFFF